MNGEKDWKIKKLFNNTGKLLKQVTPGILVDIPLLLIRGIPGSIIKEINKRKPPVVNDLHPLVILIHGTGVTSWQWGVVENYLRNHEIESAVVDYDSTNSIKDSIRHVQDQIKNICQSRDRNNIILVGHSQGGLISRWIYNESRANTTSYNIIKNFSLSAPQEGAHVCKLRNKVMKYLNRTSNISLYDMEPSSEFINEYKNMCVDNDSFLTSGKLDFVGKESALWGHDDESRKYITFAGHYYPAVDYNMWHYFIIPHIKNEFDSNNNKM